MIYLFTAILCPPGGGSQQACTKIGNRQHKRRINVENNTKTIQHYKIHKIDNKNTKQNTHKMNIGKRKSSN